MSRRIVGMVLAVVSAAIAMTACSGSTGAHTQSLSPSTSDESTTSASSQPPSSSTPAATATPPSGFGPEQPAVDTYMKLLAASNKAFRDPQHLSAAVIDTFTAGQARIEYDQSLATAKKQGIAYKGTPSTPRLAVVSSSLNGSLPTVVLRDCGLASTTDPFIGYYVATGKPVPTSKPRVSPPYAKTIKMFQPNRKSWVITSLTTDSTKTCKP